MADANQGQVESPDDFEGTPEGLVKRWLAEIDRAQSEFKDWDKRVQKIIRRYRDERGDIGSEDTGVRKFNVLWSNMQTLKPAVFMNEPKPVVERRFMDRDPVARLAAQIAERALTASMECYDFKEVLSRSTDEYLLAARGTGWVRYIPSYGPTQNKNTEEEFRPVTWEEVRAEFVSYKDFLHQPAPYWDRVSWVARRVFMSKTQLKERFGAKIAKAVPLKEEVKGGDKEEREQPLFKRAPVWEIWDKDSRRALWICPDYKDAPLDVKDDPLQLIDFFPCPRPMYGTTAPDSLVPIPDYYQYQDQALELDDLTQRIHYLTKALKVVGVYDSSTPGMGRMFEEGSENLLIPVDNWAMFAEKGGTKGTILFSPIDVIQVVLAGLVQTREQIKRDLQEISGVSDVIRGQSAASKSATAVKAEGSFVTLRLQDKQGEVGRFARDILRIKAEIIAEHFSAETIRVMSGFDQLAENDPIIPEMPEDRPSPNGTPPGPPVPAMQAPGGAAALLNGLGGMQ